MSLLKPHYWRTSSRLLATTAVSGKIPTGISRASRCFSTSFVRYNSPKNYEEEREVLEEIIEKMPEADQTRLYP